MSDKPRPPLPYLLTCAGCNRLNQGYGDPPARCAFCGLSLPAPPKGDT